MRFLRGSLGLLLAASAIVAGAADKSAEKKIPLANGQQLVLHWPTELVDSPDVKSAPAGAIAFQLSNEHKMRGAFVPLPLASNLTSDAGNLKVLTVSLQRRLEGMGGEVSKEPIALDGANAHGYYVKGVDKSARDGEYVYIYTGYVAVAGKPFLINIVWNSGGESAANAALAAVKGARIE